MSVIQLHPWGVMGVKRQVRTPRKAVAARPLPLEDDSNQIPNEVYCLIVHAQAALREGDMYRADSALELALRRLER